jgi:hypothetical protein
MRCLQHASARCELDPTRWSASGANRNAWSTACLCIAPLAGSGSCPPGQSTGPTCAKAHIARECLSINRQGPVSMNVYSRVFLFSCRPTIFWRPDEFSPRSGFCVAARKGTHSFAADVLREGEFSPQARNRARVVRTNFSSLSKASEESPGPAPARDFASRPLARSNSMTGGWRHRGVVRECDFITNWGRRRSSGWSQVTSCTPVLRTSFSLRERTPAIE